MNKERILIKIVSDTIMLGTIFVFCYRRGAVFNNPNLFKETLDFLMVEMPAFCLSGCHRNGMLIQPVKERE
jgi:hypothetical protein